MMIKTACPKENYLMSNFSKSAGKPLTGEVRAYHEARLTREQKHLAKNPDKKKLTHSLKVHAESVYDKSVTDSPVGKAIPNDRYWSTLDQIGSGKLNTRAAVDKYLTKEGGVMIKTASEQLLDHPLVSFLQEAGLEPVGMYSEDLEKEAALSLLSGIQVTPSTFDMRPGTRGYLPHERARLPHQSQRQTLSRISRMTRGPQFSGAMSPFNAQVSADRRFMNSFAKVSSTSPPAYQALKKVANPTAAVFSGPNLAQPSALMTSLTPTPGGQRVTSGLKKPKKLRAKNTASAVKLSSGLRELLLQKVAETPPAPTALRFDPQTQTVTPAAAPSATTAERTKASLKRSTPKLTDASVRPLKKRDTTTIRVNKVPRVASLSTKGDSAMQPIVFKGGKNAPSGLKLKPGKVSGGPAVT